MRSIPVRTNSNLCPQLLHYLKRAQPPAVTTAEHSIDGANIDDPLFPLAFELAEWFGRSEQRVRHDTSTTEAGRKRLPRDSGTTTANDGYSWTTVPSLDLGRRVHVSGKSGSSQYRYVPEYAHVQPSIASLFILNRHEKMKRIE
jgi:hypothetical protein